MQKRFLALFLLVLTLSALCGCGQGSGQNRLLYESQTFSLYAQGAFEDTSVAFRLFHSADGTLTLSFVEPQDFVGLTYTVYAQREATGEADLAPRGVLVAYDGIEIPLSAGEAPCAILAVAQAFSMTDASMTACKIAESESEGESDTELSFSCERGTATVILHGQHGLPRRLCANLYDVAITLDFSEWERTEAAS